VTDERDTSKLGISEAEIIAYAQRWAEPDTGQADFIERVVRDVLKIERSLVHDCDSAHDFLRRRGYRPCDIPACNCNSWHGGHDHERLREIYDALGDRTNGHTALSAVETLIAERDALEQQLDEAKSNSKRLEDSRINERHQLTAELDAMKANFGSSRTEVRDLKQQLTEMTETIRRFEHERDGMAAAIERLGVDSLAEGGKK
jgi:hypothetical protein